MADPFTCPFCGAVSHNPRDAEERYCGRCHVFIDDAIALRDGLGACRGHKTKRVLAAEQAERCQACGIEVRFDQVDNEFWGFKASCLWGGR